VTNSADLLYSSSEDERPIRREKVSQIKIQPAANVNVNNHSKIQIENRLEDDENRDILDIYLN
jgi:hypothetical protein